MSFVGLHIHSDYSLLDGASQLPDLINRAEELGMPAIALTDHGVMYGAIELLKVCKGRKVRPIIGNEMYIINGTLEETKDQRPKKYHQITLAKNKKGYQNLVKLTTASHLRGMRGRGIFARPCIDKELLAQYHEGLIVTSACLGGEIPQAIMQGRMDVAREVATWYKNLFGDDYYLEIQDHGSQEDRVVNVELVKIARELDIKILATNDSHFISCKDVEAHDALLCIQTGKLITEEKRLRYSGTEYLKSADEMRMLFRDHLEDDVIAEAIATTLEVAGKIEDYKILGEPRIPQYPVPEGYTGETYMAEVAREGLVDRFNSGSYEAISQDYRDRLEYEINMMNQMGFPDYFLVVWDYIKYARDQNIPVGPGRGSAAGSLVAYAMGITNIDPIHHGLLFERFLNPERKSMPDIDTDFCIERRGEVIDYVTEKYGEDRVAQIITFNRMTSKAVLKDVARVLNIPIRESDKMSKMIPVSRGKPEKLKNMIGEKSPEPDFKKKYDNDEVIPGAEPPISYRRWIDMAIRIEGTNKTFGVHAAGVVISGVPLDEVVPLQRNNDGSVITQYYMEDVEAMGLLKMDFLGLKNLTMIQRAVEFIEKARGEKVDPDQLAMNDAKTYELLSKGDLEGIFQLESSGMRQIVRDIKPSSLEDISSILALYRPGPLDAGLIPIFINRKHGREKIVYQHQSLEPILKDTYGVLCLPGGTLIDRPDGSRTPIEQIQAGDWVLTSDGRQVKPAQVAKQWASGEKPILKITTSTGTVLYSSPEHRFLTPEGDKCAKDLRVVRTLNYGQYDGDELYEKWPVDSVRKEVDEVMRSVYIAAIEPADNRECFDLEMVDQASPYFLAQGIVVHNCYQEQIMRMAQDLAGYSLGQADLLRRAMGKKKQEEMEKQKAMFIEGSSKNDIPVKVSEELFGQMVNFAAYCLSYDTEVVTVEHGPIAIGKIVEERMNCSVYTVDNQGLVYTQPIAQWHDRGSQEVFEYCLDNGIRIQATADHKFMSEDGRMLPIEEIFQQGLHLKVMKQARVFSELQNPRPYPIFAGK